MVNMWVSIVMGVPQVRWMVSVIENPQEGDMDFLNRGTPSDQNRTKA